MISLKLYLETMEEVVLKMSSLVTLEDLAEVDSKEDQQKLVQYSKTFNLTLDDIYNGVKKELNITIQKHCMECNMMVPIVMAKAVKFMNTKYGYNANCFSNYM